MTAMTISTLAFSIIQVSPGPATSRVSSAQFW